MNEPSARCRRRVFALLSLALAAPGLRAGDVILNEIMYHPASHQTAEEWVELYNRGAAPVNLAGWRLSAGVAFTFPPVVLPAGGHLVVAADAAAFQARYPGVTNFVAGWQGRLSDNGETLTLRNALGQIEDSVAYATEGDWAVRTRGPDDRGHRGWIWSAAHAGGGRSAERIHPGVTVDSGQNWAPSAVEGGTPGAANSVRASQLAPLILDVRHRPAVPRPTEPVLVTARVVEDQPGPLTVTVWHRVDGATNFSATPMADDGAHGDGRAGRRRIWRVAARPTSGHGGRVLRRGPGRRGPCPHLAGAGSARKRPTGQLSVPGGRPALHRAAALVPRHPHRRRAGGVGRH